MKKCYSYLQKTRRFIKGYELSIFITIVLDFLVIILGLLYPIMNKELIDNIIIPNIWGKLPKFIILLSLLYFGTILLSLISNRIYASFSETIWSNSRAELFEKVLNIDVKSKNKYTDGDLFQRINDDTATLHTLHSYYLSKFIEYSVTIVGTIIIMLTLDFKLAIITCISVPIFIVSSKIFSAKLSEEIRQVKESNSKLKNNLLNSLNFFNIIKANALEPKFANKFKKINTSTLEHQINTEYTGYLLSSVINIVTNLNQLIVIIFGSLMIMRGSITTGILIAFLGYLSNLYRPFISLSNLLKELNSAYVSIDRCLEILGYSDENKEDYINGEPLENIDGVALENVTFSYDDKKVLSNLDFDFKKGDLIQIKGKSGKGKSTIAKLLLRLYEIDSGEIKINENDIDDYNLKDIRTNILWINQDHELLDGTIREFFDTFGNYCDDELIDALKKANLLELGDKDNILDIEISKNGYPLSGGQRQRLILSRAFLENPDLIILDEPFNGIDNISRDIIWENIVDKYSEKIIIVIDHGEFFEEFNPKILELRR